MRYRSGMALCALLISTLAMPVGAATGAGMGGPMATCPPHDPAVIVNTTKMTYIADTKANRVAMKGMMEHDRFVCSSVAKKMGARARAASPSMAEKPSGKM